MTYKTVLSLFIIVVIYISAYSQNLVPNSGFEQETVIDDSTGCIEYSFPGWKILNGNSCGFSYFIDYREYLKNNLDKFNRRLTGLVKKWKIDARCEKYRKKYPGSLRYGKNLCFYRNKDKKKWITNIDTAHTYWRAYRGNCFISNCCSFRRELFQVELKEKLQKDSCYQIEFYYFLSKYLTDTSYFKNGEFGVYFTNTDFASKNVDITSDVRYTPMTTIDRLDTAALHGWVKFSKSFIAKGDFKYMIIGNYEPFNTSKEGSPVIYHIDNVAVRKQECKRNDDTQ